MDAALTRYRDLLLWRVPPACSSRSLAAWWLSGSRCARSRGWPAAAREIDVQTLERRLPVRGVGDELDEVADAFNETLGRLEHAVGEMRQFSAALAHELRTPLAALRGEIELALRDSGIERRAARALASQIEEIDRLTRLIDQILTLARAEAGQIRLDLSRRSISASSRRRSSSSSSRSRRRGRSTCAASRRMPWSSTATPAGSSGCC